MKTSEKQPRKKVHFISRILPHYQKSFFEKIKPILLSKGIEFNLIYGQSDAAEAEKKDTVDLEWGIKIKNIYLAFGLVWQPCYSIIRHSDLVMIEQANRFLLNYILMLLHKATKKKIAYYGHGKNHQADTENLTNKFKRLYSRECDWWFCYTDSVKESITSLGYPETRITVFQNSIDTLAIQAQSDSISNRELRDLRNAEHIGAGPIGIYCGALYKEKRIDFLISACMKIRELVPGFEMIVVGSGIEKPKIESAASSFAWFHYVGARFGTEKIRYMRISDVFLIPGAVGLAVLDAFCCQVPLITTAYPFHGPEIDYVMTGVNGLITKDCLEDYVGETVRLLNDAEKLMRMKSECKTAASRFSIENMASRFAEGIELCLNS